VKSVVNLLLLTPRNINPFNPKGRRRHAAHHCVFGIVRRFNDVFQYGVKIARDGYLLNGARFYAVFYYIAAAAYAEIA
jgi:hypothetical protein